MPAKEPAQLVAKMQECNRIRTSTDAQNQLTSRRKQGFTFNRGLELLKQPFHVGPLPNFREWNGMARSQKNEPCRTDFRPLLGHTCSTSAASAGATSNSINSDANSTTPRITGKRITTKHRTEDRNDVHGPWSLRRNCRCGLCPWRARDGTADPPSGRCSCPAEPWGSSSLRAARAHR